VDAIGHLDILVNNVSLFEVKKFEDIDDDEWLKYWNINVMSCIRLSRAFLHKMIARNSVNIVMISSEVAFNPMPEMVHYCVTKSAQVNLARGLARLTKGTKVRVNSLLPGPTWTEGVAEWIQKLAKEKGISVEEQKKTYFISIQPLSLVQRFLAPEEVANNCVFLCSDAASAINGASFRSEGGILHI